MFSHIIFFTFLQLIQYGVQKAVVSYSSQLFAFLELNSILKIAEPVDHDSFAIQRRLNSAPVLPLNSHRWTGRYEAHLWDKSSWNQAQNKKGRQGLIPTYFKVRLVGFRSSASPNY